MTSSTEKLLAELDRLGRGVERRTRSYRDYRRHELTETPAHDRQEVRSAVWKYLLLGKPLLSVAEQRALSKASGPVGGFLVPTDLADEVVATARAVGSLSRVAREIVTETGDTIGLPTTTGHGSSAWIGEAAPGTPTDEAFGQLSLGAHKAGTSVIVSEELAQDATAAFDAYLAEELGLRIAALEAAAYINGTGTGQPQGAVANLTAVVAASGSTTSFTYTDIVNLVHAVPVEYRQLGGDSLAFVGSDGVLKALRLKLDTAGNPIMAPGTPPELLGYPFLVEPNLPGPAANAKTLMFGAWKFAYAIRRVDGVGLQRLVEAFSNNGQIGFRAVHRVDGRVLIADAARALQHSAT